MNPTITIAGAGNWLIAIDRIGPLIIQQIKGRYSIEQVEVRAIGGTALALLDILHGQKLLLLIDACNNQGSPGEVTCYIPDLNSNTVITGNLHQIGPLETLLIAKHLYPEILPQHIMFIAIETEGLSAEIENTACQTVIKILDREVEYWLNK
jgi:hydrogenase maturation protease